MGVLKNQEGQTEFAFLPLSDIQTFPVLLFGQEGIQRNSFINANIDSPAFPLNERTFYFKTQ
jgi:hypothetical protein